VCQEAVVLGELAGIGMGVVVELTTTIVTVEDVEEEKHEPHHHPVPPQVP